MAAAAENCKKLERSKKAETRFKKKEGK